MIISKIIVNKIAYYFLHAEVAYSINPNTGKDILGIDSSFLHKDVLDNIFDNILNDEKSSIYVLDFEGIKSVQINVLEEKISLLINEYNKNIIMSNVLVDIINNSMSFKLHIKNNKKYLRKKNVYSFFCFCKIDCGRLSDSESVFHNDFTKKMKKYKKKRIIEHHSSSVFLSAYIDIKQFITKDKLFFLYSIYRLAKKIKGKKEWLESFTSNDKPILICQSLNGSFIASILSSLLGLDLFIIDGVGPINKPYRSLGATILAGKKYIVVSDVVCLGTEVKITKNIIEYLGGIYYGNVSIVRIKSIKPYDNVESVFCIDKNNKNDFQYKIITSLD